MGVLHDYYSAVNIEVVPPDCSIFYHTGRKINGKTQSSQKTHENDQRLTSEEEQALKKWILKMAEWGLPARITHVREMVIEMLGDKGDRRPLGKNWITLFLHFNEDCGSSVAWHI